MRILMVSHGYPPVLSGVTLVVQKIARAMVRRGHDVTVVTSSDHKEPYRTQDKGVHLVKVNSISNPWWEEAPIPFVGQHALAEVAEEVEPHILHTHDAGFLGLQALRLSRKTDLPLLATCYFVPRFVAHYVTWDGEPHEAIESITWAYSEWLFNRFDHVVFATYAHRQAFLAKGLEVPTSIISNGLDIERYSPGPGNTRVAERYALPPGRRILFVSRIAQDKRIEILIEAMTRVSAELEAHLLIVGRGDDRPRLEEMVAEKGLKDWVHFMGFVPEGDMPALYRLADCFAITSTCEVQSLPTLQAVATGLPVVAADAMALPELVHDGENGYLVPPEDPMATASALLKILQQPALAASMKQAGRRIAQAHDESRTFDQYEQLYYRMADQGEMTSWLGPAAKVSRQRDHA